MLENCYVALLFVPNVTRKWCRLKYGWISPCHFYGFFFQIVGLSHIFQTGTSYV